MFKKNKIKFLSIIIFVLISINIFSTETDTEYNDEKAKQLTGDIIFSVPSGTFQGSLTVSLSSEIVNSQIRYTTNGTVPTNNSSLYNSALTFTSTTQLRAQTYVNGVLNGEMGSAVYIACSSNPNMTYPL
ncbi:MAG: chitobiase/beta-hexosaminidase C-terminal domain-containing protein [Candidatus Pacearchaeota archaeon]|nr:chitobiase/beta-hexosaminidase C-terminal domain-containing protein [Candidatus Pacearchaeota archaeon]